MSSTHSKCEVVNNKDIEGGNCEGNIHDQNNEAESAPEMDRSDSKTEVIDNNNNNGESTTIEKEQSEKSANEKSSKDVNHQESAGTGEKDCYSDNVNSGPNSNGGSDTNSIYLNPISEMLETQKSDEKTEG